MSKISNAEDSHFMQMAIALSRRGVGLSTPNPSVGVLVVKNGVIVGRGVTAQGGRPHAERIALNQAGEAANGSTIYVTLEPCARRSQQGATSCTDAIIQACVSRVVIGASDPSVLAAGQGAERLRAQGVAVVAGIESKAARWVNLGHILRVSQCRPMVTLKLAQTLDGFAGTLDHKPLAITGQETRTYVHMMRAQSDAVAAGISTVLADNPLLDVRLHGLEGRSSARVIFDSNLKLPIDSKLVATAAKVPLWVIADVEASVDNERALTAAGVDVMRIKKHDLKAALELLANRGISRLMLEGGPTLANAFASQGFVDEFLQFTAPWKANEGIKAIGSSLNSLTKTCSPNIQIVGNDQLHHFKFSY